jgi:Xaa-Pro aminopeptidase
MEKEKISQAIQLLNELDLDCWMVIDKESEILTDPIMDFIIGTGVTWLSFFLFFKTGEKYALVGNLDIEKIKRLEIFDDSLPYKNSPSDDLIKILKKHDPQKIAINYSLDSPAADGLTYGRYLQFDSPAADGLTYGRYLQLLDILKNTEFSSRIISAEEIISKLRGRKSKEEISRIKKAIDITLEIYSAVTETVKPGFTEKQVAQFITQKRKKLGFEPSWDEEHCPSVFAGPQETGAHSGPTDRKLQPGHVFNIDFGIIYNKYCSDLQRTWYLLKQDEINPPEAVLKGFNTIVESIQLAFQALKPGVEGISIDKIARHHIISQGYTEYPHALGHQVGRSSHDGGALLAPAWERYGKLPFIPLEEDQVFTIEPRLYLEDHGVITIEEMVVITRDGAEWLSEPQKEIYLIQ